MRSWHELLFLLRKKRVQRATRVVCDHMLFIYNYFQQLNPLEPENCLIKEALGMLHNWHKVSSNTFKHQPSGATIEIRKDAKLEEVTREIIRLEIPYLALTRSELPKRLLTEMAMFGIDDFYRQHKILGR